MTKETLLQILNLSQTKQITEKEACKQILQTDQRQNLSYWKRKYGLSVYKTGYHPNSGIKRTFTLNENYFSNITIQNSYYAGFIMADGNITQDKKYLTISLSRKDRSFLESFIKDISATYSVKDGNSHGYPISSIHFSSKQICCDLETNFNIVPNKSLIASPPKLEKIEYIDSFIMGLIDGDGTIGLQKHKNTQDRFYISLVGTKEICKFVKNRFEEILQKSTSNLFQKDKTKNFHFYRISDNNARTIFKFYYENYKTISKLNRKWSKEHYDYCLNFQKALPICRRKGVNIFNLNGELIKHCDTLLEAQKFTGVSCGSISKLCKFNDNNHMGNGYMFSRDKEHLEKYCPAHGTNSKYLNKEQQQLDAGESNIEDNN